MGLFSKTKKSDDGNDFSSWLVNETEIIHTPTSSHYEIKELFGAYSKDDERLVLWRDNHYIGAVKCKQTVKDTLLERGLFLCDDYFPSLEFDSAQSVEGQNIEIEDIYLLLDKERHLISQCSIASGPNKVELVKNDRVLALLDMDNASAFINAFNICKEYCSASLSGRGLKEFQRRMNLVEEKKRKKEAEKAYNAARKAGFPGIILTTETVSPFKVKKYLGLITAEYAHRTTTLKELTSDISSFGKSRTTHTQNALKAARETALIELKDEAYQLGANAVIGIDLDYSEISSAGNPTMFLVVSGTAIDAHLE